jgi:hypothetical protein
MTELQTLPKIDHHSETRRILQAAVDILDRATTAALKNTAELRYYESSLSYLKICLTGKDAEVDPVFIVRLRNTFYRFNEIYPSSIQSKLFHRQDIMDQLDSHIAWLKLREYI